MATKHDTDEIDMNARIAAILRDISEVEQRRVQTRYESWKAWSGAVLAGAGLIGVTITLTKLFL